MTVDAPPAGTARRAGTTAAALAASELLGKVATFLIFLFFARLLGVVDFGVLSMGFALGLLLAVLSSLGLDTRVVQLGSAHPEMLDRCYGALIAIRVVLCGAITVVTAAVAFAQMPAADATAVVLIVASCLVETFSDAARAVCGARQAQHLTAVVLVLQRFGTLAVTIGVLLVHPSVPSAALAYLVGTVGGVLGMQLAARRAGVRLQVRGSRHEAILILKAAPVVALNAIATMGLFRIDATLIGVLLGTTAVGIYSASYRLFETIIFVSWTLSRTFAPIIASRPDDTAHLRTWTQRALLVMLAVYVPYGVVLALRGDDVVGALFGHEYADPGLLVALATAPLLFGVGHLCATVLLAIHPDPLVLVASVVALVVNIGLNLVLIPTAGITGAAWATSISFLIQTAILWRGVARLTGPILHLRSVAGVLAGSAAAAVACLGLAPLLPSLLVAGLAYVVVTVLVTRLADPATIAGLRRLRAG